ncbi:hypothetical protein UlMin_024061 [Ulmus minor]
MKTIIKSILTVDLGQNHHKIDLDALFQCCPLLICLLSTRSGRRGLRRSTRGAKVLKTRKTPMVVANPREVPDYELNPLELHVRNSDGITKGTYQVAKWNGTKVSVKILDRDGSSDPETINAFKQELTLLEKVRHPTVVQFVGAVTQNMPMMIVLEYHPKGDLGSYIQRKGRLSPSKALRFALDVASGMNYLHECKPDPIIHCDLKPNQKVFGFGLARVSRISPDKAKLEQGRVNNEPPISKNEVNKKIIILNNQINF